MAKLARIDTFSNNKFVSNGSFYCKLVDDTLKIWSTFSNTLNYQSQDQSITTTFEEPLGGTLTYSYDAPLLTNFFARNPISSLETQNSTTSAQIAFSTTERTSFNASPFTIMFWMKASDASYQTVLTLGGSSIAVGVNGTTGGGGTATIRLIADFTGTDGVFISDVSNTLSTCQNTWVHICVSYDPRSTSNVPKFYVNGERLGSNTSTPPVGGGMLLVTFLNLGSDGNPGTTKYSNYMHFNGAVVADEDVKAIYNASLYQAFSSRSGIVSNPVRIMLQEKDNRTGSYPTIARIGDPDFTGIYQSFYDDTNTVNFVGNSQTLFPMNLPASSKWVSGNVATPNILQGLTTFGTASKGVSDVHVSFTPGQNISPFNESRVYIDNDAEFYQIGTDESVLPGFGQRLSSKAIIDLSTNPITTTNVVFSTGTNELTKPQTFVLRFVNASKSSYVPAAPANSHAITISVTGSSVSDDIPGSSTTGGNATSTYGFVFNDGSNQGNIADLTTRQKVIIDISSAANSRDIAQAFVTGVNNLTNAPFFAEFTTNARIDVFNNYGDTLASANHPANRNYVVIRNKNPGKPLLGTSATTKVDYTSFSYTNGGPSCDGAEGFLSTVISGTVLCTGVDQTLYANSNQGIAAGINSGISYFNWESKKWELIGNHTRGRNVDYANSEPHIVTSSMLATIPVAFTNSKIRDYDYSQLGNLTGLPCDTAGFPLSVKFDATGSQVISMTGSLSSPFMVEKISLTFSASMGIGGFTDVASQAHNATFFLILQREQPLNSTIDGTFENFNLFKSPNQINSHAIKQKQQKDRRIVWFGRVGKYNSSQISLENLQAVSSSLYNSCDLWIGNNYSSVTGTFTVNAPCRVVGKTPRATPNLFTREMNLVNSFFGIQDGGRNLENISDGRSFIRGVLGSQLSGSITTIESNEGNDYIKTYANVFADSPFVMLPNDKLILAFVNQPFPNSFGTPEVFNESQLIVSHSFNLCPGAGNITLYGSLLRNNLLVSPETNQPLTSEAIHEDLHYDNPVFDQFDVEPYAALTGSYVDLIITGSMLVTPIGDSNAPNVRKVQASVAAGQAGSTGSLQRFVKLISESDLFYDTLIPNPAEINSADGFSLGTDSGKTFLLFSDVNVNVISNENYVWWHSYPFESKYISAKRRLADSIVGFDIDGSGLGFGGFFLTGSQFLQDEMGRPRNLGLFITSSYVEGLKSFFGIPRNFTTARVTQNGASSEAIIAGFKYGIQNCLPMKTTANFRRDRYGQFRDMLEQSPNAAYLVENSVEYPLEVKFFSRQGKDGKGSATTDPTQTHSQNLSDFATSSLPYFDGVVRERPDNPDITVEPIELG